MRRRAAVLVVLVVLGGSCTDGGPGPQPSPSQSVEAFHRGGTLRVAIVDFNVDVGPKDKSGLDPQFNYLYPGWELFRCCLLRTLLSYNGRSWDRGGNELRPDLATALPSVSTDGLTWTFHLRDGLHYAPPLQRVEITAPDVVRALEREATEGSYAFYYSGVGIRGFDAYAHGKADGISGLLAPNDHTLRVELNRPASDLGYLFAMPASAPIPPIPDASTTSLGAATGHDQGYGRFLVASGPYMVQGADRMDFSAPPGSQVPASGYVPGRSIALVRNPSWSPSTDPLRDAYPDRIVVRLVPDFDAAARALESGRVDVLMDLVSDPEDLVSRLQANPQTQGRVFTRPVNGVAYAEINVAQPPLDDLHVRRAMNLAVDRETVVPLLRRAGLSGEPAAHISPDGLEGGLLLRFDPNSGQGAAGSLEAAREEMKRSAYDQNHDGRCDRDACTGIIAITKRDGPYIELGETVKRDLARIGLHIKVVPTNAWSFRCEDHSAHVGICLPGNWEADYPSAENFFSLEFSSKALSSGCCNSSLVGASARQLRTWGYPPRPVPNVDSRIRQCAATVGSGREPCWAELDKFLTDDVVPWIPFEFLTVTRTVSDRVARFSFDQFTSMPALDQIALNTGSA